MDGIMLIALRFNDERSDPGQAMRQALHTAVETLDAVKGDAQVVAKRFDPEVIPPPEDVLTANDSAHLRQLGIDPLKLGLAVATEGGVPVH
jgi:hypothetical protein